MGAEYHDVGIGCNVVFDLETERDYHMFFKIVLTLFGLLLLPLAYVVFLSGQWLIALAMVLATIVLLAVVIFGAGVKNNNVNTIFGKGDIHADVTINHDYTKE